MHHTKSTGFSPWSFDHPPTIRINISATETSMIKTTIAFAVLLAAFSRFGYTTA
jgi:hypothetical protein